MDTGIIAGLLRKKSGQKIEVLGFQPVGGGSINAAYKVITTAAPFFLKVNRGAQAATMFAAEVKGLNLLRRRSGFTIPQVITLHTQGNASYLLMEFIEAAGRRAGYWRELAVKLAGLHRQKADFFGLDHDNFIGSLPQSNTKTTGWPAFFATQRITPMLKLAFDRHLVDKGFTRDVEAVLNRLTSMMPTEPPALLHGDLWSGNLMVDAAGNPCLVDPAVYYGHREMDLAFSHLFGGFSAEFYRAYAEVYPLEPGFEERLDLYNLYPLFVHLNLFGRSYFGQLNAIISRFA